VPSPSWVTRAMMVTSRAREEPSRSSAGPPARVTTPLTRHPGGINKDGPTLSAKQRKQMEGKASKHASKREHACVVCARVSVRARVRVRARARAAQGLTRPGRGNSRRVGSRYCKVVG